MNMSSYLSSLIFPAVVSVLAALASYYATRKLQQAQNIDDRERKRFDFLERAFTDVTKLQGLLNRLVDDPAKFLYFSLENTGAALLAVNKIQSYLPDLIIFPQEDFRKIFSE